MKNDLQERLGEISARQPSPDTIAGFAEGLERDAEELVKDIMSQVAERIERVKKVADAIQKRTSVVPQVITPPENRPTRVTGEKKDEKSSKKVNRLDTLLYVLDETEVDISEITILEGSLNEKQWRREPYKTVIVEDIDRVVQVCDEKQNITYVFQLSRLEELGVSLEQLNDMTKKEKDELMEEHGHGARLTYQGDWNERIKKLLYDKTELNHTEKLPMAIRDQENPMHGFWIDEAGEAHGPLNNIATHLGISAAFAKEITVELDLKPMPIRDCRGQDNTGYKLSEFLKYPRLAEFLSVARVDIEGEYKDFRHDGTSGKHYGTDAAIARRLGLHVEDIKQILAELETGLTTQKIRLEGGGSKDGHALEEVADLPEIIEARSRPKVETEGEWASFAYDEELGEHVGQAAGIRERLEQSGLVQLNSDQFKNYATKRGFGKLRYRSSTDMLVKGYSFEAIERDVLDFKEHQGNYDFQAAGEWQGFAVNSEGQHLGQIGTIADKLGVSHKTAQKAVEELDLEPTEVRTSLVHKRPMYSIEQIKNSSIIQRNINAKAAETEGEWEGFYIDPEGKHWGTKDDVKRVLGLSALKGAAGMRTTPIRRSSSGRGLRQPIDAICLEDLEKA